MARGREAMPHLGMDRIQRVDVEGRQCHALERDGLWHQLDGDLFGTYRAGATLGRHVTRVLAPVSPSKIVAVGLNYRDHAQEMGKPLPSEPLIFLKPSTAVIGPGDPIVVPPGAGRVDHEAELGIVIGRTARNVPATRAMDYVLGLTCVNDVTARELQSRDVQFTRAKGFDTFAPIGPVVVTGLDAGALDIEASVNGQRRQASNTRELIFPLDRLIEFISAVMTLLPGDVIATGTPSGVGPIVPGDRVTVRVAGIGELVNEVVAG